MGTRYLNWNLDTQRVPISKRVVHLFGLISLISLISPYNFWQRDVVNRTKITK